MKKIFIVVLILTLVMTSIGLVYGEDTISDESVNLSEENIFEVTNDDSILIATEDEETGETIYCYWNKWS